MNVSTISVHCSVARQISLSDVVTAMNDQREPFFGMLQTRSECLFVASGESGVSCSDGKEPDLTQVYNARLFSATMEIHWMREDEGAGDAARIAERPATEKFWTAESPDTCHYIDDTLLLWGETSPSAVAGWTTMSTARIGSFPVPFPTATAGARIGLTRRTYFIARTQDDGNLVFRAGRLTGFTHVKKPDLNTGRKHA